MERLDGDLLQDVVINDGHVGADGRRGGSCKIQTLGHGEVVHVVQYLLLSGRKGNRERLRLKVNIDCRSKHMNIIIPSLAACCSIGAGGEEAHI